MAGRYLTNKENNYENWALLTTLVATVYAMAGALFESLTHVIFKESCRYLIAWYFWHSRGRQWGTMCDYNWDWNNATVHADSLVLPKLYIVGTIWDVQVQRHPLRTVLTGDGESSVPTANIFKMMPLLVLLTT